MVRPRRGGRPAPRKRKRRLGSLLVFVGLLAVLGGTFAAGALAGRFSLRPSASLANVKSVDRAPKPAASPPPELTFYRELTAPLAPPPLPPKPAAKPAPTKREGTSASPSGESVRRAETTEAPPRPVPDAAAPARADAGRYTVQVGSYNARAHAEALRARLASAGHDAYVAEGEAGGATRYRVRIGVFTTAEEAREAAVRLASEAHVATYVTTR